MKLSKREAGVVSMFVSLFMLLIFLGALVNKDFLDIVYVLIIIGYLSRLIYIQLAYKDDEDDVTD